ncbi:AraC family transcriptional regulator [Collinsella sp. TM05-37]|nr:AraC family transcriptional regulator [Collinsella sp. TM05-37]
MDCYEHELVRGAAAGRDESGRAASLVAGMLGYIERSFATCSLEEMAARFHVSPNYASALLKQHVGKTYRQLVQERRLARAAELLRTGATAEAAARAVGYENMSFFYRKFRTAYGCTPATYRG